MRYDFGGILVFNWWLKWQSWVSRTQDAVWLSERRDPALLHCVSFLPAECLGPWPGWRLRSTDVNTILHYVSLLDCSSLSKSRLAYSVRIVSSSDNTKLIKKRELRFEFDARWCKLASETEALRGWVDQPRQESGGQGRGEVPVQVLGACSPSS